MRELAALLLIAVVAAPAEAQSDRMRVLARAQSTIALSLPFDRVGEYLPDDAGTVLHWDADRGSTVGPSFTMNGSVPLVSESPLYPNGFAQAARKGYGPMSTGNYMSMPDPGVLDLGATGSATVEFVATLMDPTNASGQVFLTSKQNGTSTTAGVDLRVAASGNFACRVADGTTVVESYMSAGVQGTTNHYACRFVRSGANMTIVAYVNGEASVVTPTTAVGSVSGSGVIKLGLTGTGSPLLGTVYEVHVTRRALSAAELADRARRFFSLQGTRGEPVTFTRAATRSCVINGVSWTLAANVPCVNEFGLSTGLAGELISVANPLVGYSGPFAVALTSLPADWSTAATQVHLSTGSLSAANNWGVYSLNTGVVRFISVNADAVSRYASRNEPAVGEHRLAGLSVNGSEPVSMSLAIDAVGAPGTLTGTGGHITTQPATLYLGSAAAGASPANGTIRDVIICKTANAARCK